MVTIDPLLLESAWAGALPGRETAELNAVLRAIAEALRQPQRSPNTRFHKPH